MPCSNLPLGVSSILSYRLKPGVGRADIEGYLRVVTIDEFGSQEAGDDNVWIFAVDGGRFVVEVDAHADAAQAEQRQHAREDHEDQADWACASHYRGRACGGYGGHMPRLAVRRAVGSVGHSGALLYRHSGR